MRESKTIRSPVQGYQNSVRSLKFCVKSVDFRKSLHYYSCISERAGVFLNKIKKRIMNSTNKALYAAPAVRLIETDLEVNFTLSAPTLTTPYEDEQDW